MPGKFRTQFESQKKVPANVGDPIKVLYGPIFDEHGVMDLKETGRENLYDYIQSHADSVDIHVLLKQYAETGDPGLFSRVQGAYGDFTQMPTTFAGALNTLIAAEQYFEGLPVDVRAQFGHSFQQFIASMDKSDFAARMGFDPQITPEEAASEVSAPAPEWAPETAPAPAPARSPSPAPAPAPTRAPSSGES